MIKEKWEPGICAWKRCRQTADLEVFSSLPDGRVMSLCPRHMALSSEPVEEKKPSTELTIPQDVETLSLEAQQYLAGSLSLPAVRSEGELNLAAEVLAAVKGIAKRLEERKKEATGPLSQSLTKIREWFAPALDACQKTEADLKGKIAAYHSALAATRAAAAAQINAAATSEEVTSALAVLGSAEEPERIKGLSVRYTEEWEVTDASLLPVEFTVRVPDMEHIARAIAAGAVIPGVRVWKKPIVASRSM